jgi:hypothetical protein
VPRAKPESDNTTFSDEFHSAVQFEAFWDMYPRKVGKGAARKAWKSATKRATGVMINLALSVQKHAGMFDKETQFIPHPTTWLNQERWEDEIPVAWTPGSGGSPPPMRNGAASLLLREATTGCDPWEPVAIEGPTHV